VDGFLFAQNAGEDVEKRAVMRGSPSGVPMRVHPSMVPMRELGQVLDS